MLPYGNKNEGPQFTTKNYRTDRYDSRTTTNIKGQFEREQRRQEQRKVKNFNIETDESDDEFDLDDHPKVLTLECENFYVTSKLPSLIRARADLEVKYKIIEIPMLIDCGAISSLINPEVLPEEEARAIENYLKHGTQPDFLKNRRSR